jgi:hypothetical protein
MQVLFGIDCSYSMDDEFKDGSVQTVTDQMLGIGMKFDDDGEIDVFKFASDAQYVGKCTEADYGKYIRTSGLKPYGGTAFSPLIKLMPAHIFGAPAASPAPAKTGLFGFGKKETVQPSAAASAANQTPALALIVTDGAPFDEGGGHDAQFRAIRPSLVAAQAYPIYFHFIGISNQPGTFRVLEMLANDLPNVGFVPLSGFNKSDDEIYGEIICKELVDWVKSFANNTATA